MPRLSPLRRFCNATMLLILTHRFAVNVCGTGQDERGDAGGPAVHSAACTGWSSRLTIGSPFQRGISFSTG